MQLLDGAQTLCQDTVTKAAMVSTKFWLAKEELTHLLACGQATICYNLLKHMQFMLDKEPYLKKNHQFKKLYDDIKSDWEHLKTDSNALVNDPYAHLFP